MVAVRDDYVKGSVAALEHKIDILTDQVAFLVAQQRPQDDLMAEIGPIGREVLKVAIQKFGELEDKGYTDFARELIRVLDVVVTHYGAEDVRQLGDNVVRILDTIKNITQPDIMAIASEATDVIRDADATEAPGVFGMLKSAKDEDVRRGVAVTLEILRHVGRAAPRMSRGAPSAKSRKLQRMIGPTRGAALSRASSQKERPKRLRKNGPTCSSPSSIRSKSNEITIQIDGVSITGEGYLANHEAWTEELAQKIADQLGVGELNERHWKVIHFARKDFLDNGASPNIRRIAVGSGVGTRDIYQLFKKAPGQTAARIAGIPKPAGCI